MVVDSMDKFVVFSIDKFLVDSMDNLLNKRGVIICYNVHSVL